MKSSVVQQDAEDLSRDYHLYGYLAGDAAKKLAEWRRRAGTPDETVRECADRLSANLESVMGELRLPPTAGGKRKIFGTIRTVFGLLGFIRTAEAWQSPSFASSVFSQNGPLQGTITAHHNDYTRDQHSFGNAYAGEFIREYVTKVILKPVYAFTTSSGMSAYAVAALYAKGNMRPDGSVLMGSSVYFENKDVLHTLFGERLVEVDDTDNGLLIAEIRKRRPGAVFLDTLANHPSMAVPDTGNVIRAMPRNSFCVLDNSAFAAASGPLMTMPVLSGRIRLVVVESLNKFHQFGMDRVTGGMVWGTGPGAIQLYDYRDRFGANISDYGAAVLPTPNRKFLEIYQHRLGRNALYLAERLDGSQKRFTVTYPGLSSFGQKHTQAFHGAYLVLNGTQAVFSERVFEGYIKRVFSIAAKRNIPLIGGTSFGLPVTRLYTVGMRGTYAQPFLRISPGMETTSEIAAIADILCNVASAI